MTKATPSRRMTPADTTQAVDELMMSLEHRAKNEIEALRKIILGAHSSIKEGVKWKAPSFRTNEYFATMHLRTKNGIGVILHFGAKVRDVGAVRESINDPKGMLEWLAKDRAIVTFESISDMNRKKPDFQAILRQWIAHI